MSWPIDNPRDMAIRIAKLEARLAEMDRTLKAILGSLKKLKECFTILEDRIY